MTTWRRILSNAAVSGSVASLTSTAALALCGLLERGSAAGPLNGPSQWIWGRWAAYRRDASLPHTAVGYLIHHLSALFWAICNQGTFNRRPHPEKSGSRELSECAMTASMACFVDYQLTPKRLQPGYETQLSRYSLFVVYTAFALGLAAGNALLRRVSR